MAQTANTFDISERAILACLSIQQWGNSRKDRGATAAVQSTYKAAHGSGQYSKKLIHPGTLKPISQAATKARKLHDHYTLPWSTAGVRIMPAAAFEEYTQAMAPLKAEFEQEVARFIADFPNHVNRSKVRLGKMFNAADYPDQADLTQAYAFDTDFQQIASEGDFRVALSADLAETMRQNVQAHAQRTVGKAVDAAKERLLQACWHMVERLNAYEPGTKGKRAQGEFRDTVVTNIQDLVAVMPMLNVTGDARFAAEIERVRSNLTEHDAATLRASAKIRKQVADKAKASADALAGMLSDA